MLEVKEYKKCEIAEILKTKEKQGIDRKLTRYGVDFTSRERGEDRIYTIKKVPNIFKMYCITELGMPSNSPFDRLKYLFYRLLNDDAFAALPIVKMEVVLKKEGKYLANGTIGKWVRFLQKINYIHLSKENGICYAITKTPDQKKHYREIQREVYNKGWSIYWQSVNRYGSRIAYERMFEHVGGHPYRRLKIEHNIICLAEINKLIDVINEDFLNEI